ncbi:MAG: hypothetical protein WC539_10600, partial [Nitrospirota bacterium]
MKKQKNRKNLLFLFAEPVQPSAPCTVLMLQDRKMSSSDSNEDQLCKRDNNLFFQRSDRVTMLACKNSRFSSRHNNVLLFIRQVEIMMSVNPKLKCPILTKVKMSGFVLLFDAVFVLKPLPFPVIS